ncbi:Transient receptor potential cation channel subfamily A member 1, partial [Paramuricea clavata]
MYNNGEITLNDEELIQQMSRKLNVEVCHVVQSIEHLRNLEASKRRREKENEEKNKRRFNMKYEDYDWIDLVVSGKINKLYSAELDKYLVEHQLNTKCRKSDKIKAVTVHALRAGATVVVIEKQNVYNDNWESDNESDSESTIESDCSDDELD